jgi:hypothetical protein
MSRIEVTIREGKITFECDCLVSHFGLLCPQCQDLVKARLEILMNEEI